LTNDVLRIARIRQLQFDLHENRGKESIDRNPAKHKQKKSLSELPFISFKIKPDFENCRFSFRKRAFKIGIQASVLIGQVKGNRDAQNNSMKAYAQFIHFLVKRKDKIFNSII